MGGGGDTCAGLAGEGETGESQPREPACMWRVWPSVAVSIRAVQGLREILLFIVPGVPGPSPY